MHPGEVFVALRQRIKEEDVEGFFRIYKRLGSKEVLEKQWDKQGRTLLHRIAASRNHQFLKGLIDEGLNWSIKALYKKQCTPFHLAAQEGSFRNVLVLAYKHPGLIKERDIEGNLALHYAIYKKRNAIILLRQQLEIPLNALGQTSLHVAVRSYREGKKFSRYSTQLPLLFFLYVQKFGKDIVDIKDVEGRTALDMQGYYIEKNEWNAMRTWIESAIKLATTFQFSWRFEELSYLNHVLKNRMPLPLKILKYGDVYHQEMDLKKVVT